MKKGVVLSKPRKTVFSLSEYGINLSEYGQEHRLKSLAVQRRVLGVLNSAKEESYSPVGGKTHKMLSEELGLHVVEVREALRELDRRDLLVVRESEWVMNKHGFGTRVVWRRIEEGRL